MFLDPGAFLGGTYVISLSCPKESPPFLEFFRYDVYEDIVDLSQTFLVVEEVRRCTLCSENPHFDLPGR